MSNLAGAERNSKGCQIGIMGLIWEPPDRDIEDFLESLTEGSLHVEGKQSGSFEGCRRDPFATSCQVVAHSLVEALNPTSQS